MTFKDRLREEINFQGKLVKELSAEIGISNSTFLSYIDARGTLPNVETGVKIANALNTSVEYLVTGKKNDPTADITESSLENYTPPPTPTGVIKNTEIHDIISDLKKMSPKELKMVQKMIHALVE